MICVCIYAWLVCSYVDTMAHHMTDHLYAGWNLFEIMAGKEDAE